MTTPKKNPGHIYDVLQPLLAFSKVFGLTAFCLKGDPPYVNMKVTWANYATLLVNFVANSFCVYLNIQTCCMSKMTGSAVMNTGLNFLFPLGAIIMMALAIDNFLRRKSTCAIIADFFEVDRSLQRKNYQTAHQCHLRALSQILIVSVLLVAAGTIFSLVMALSSPFPFHNHMINAFSYALTGIEFLIINFHFICAARLVAFRLSDVEHCLKRYLKRETWRIEREDRWGRKVEPIDIVNELAGDAAALVRIVERINRIYANQIVICIVGVGMFSIFVIYASAYSFFFGKTEEFRFSIILLMAWMFYIIMMAHTFSAGTDVVNGGRRVVLFLHEAISLVEDTATRKKLLCFSLQLLLRQPKLQSLICELNWKTMFSMCGFIVTYLIILMQFDDTS